MTVKELRELLAKENEDSDVVLRNCTRDEEDCSTSIDVSRGLYFARWPFAGQFWYESEGPSAGEYAADGQPRVPAVLLSV